MTLGGKVSGNHRGSPRERTLCCETRFPEFLEDDSFRAGFASVRLSRRQLPSRNFTNDLEIVAVRWSGVSRNGPSSPSRDAGIEGSKFRDKSACSDVPVRGHGAHDVILLAELSFSLLPSVATAAELRDVARPSRTPTVG